jgi:hypothetical protein
VQITTKFGAAQLRWERTEFVGVRRKRITRSERQPMNRYEMVFNGDSGAAAPVPQVGETLEIAGELWDVDTVDDGRIHLVHHEEAEDAEVQAHIRFGVAKAPPTSFEAELVYTLNDLSTRLSTLASVHTAYWGKGAA